MWVNSPQWTTSWVEVHSQWCKLTIYMCIYIYIYIGFFLPFAVNTLTCPAPLPHLSFRPHCRFIPALSEHLLLSIQLLNDSVCVWLFVKTPQPLFKLLCSAKREPQKPPECAAFPMPSGM